MIFCMLSCLISRFWASVRGLIAFLTERSVKSIKLGNPSQEKGEIITTDYLLPLALSPFPPLSHHNPRRVAPQQFWQPDSGTAGQLSEPHPSRAWLVRSRPSRSGQRH